MDYPTHIFNEEEKLQDEREANENMVEPSQDRTDEQEDGN